MNVLVRTLRAVALVAMVTAPVAAQETIKLGTMTWEDLTPITGITKSVLEDKGFTVEVTEFSEWGIAYAALAKGDIQLLASQVDYAAQDYWDRYKSRIEKISPVSHGLENALAVPSYVEANSIADLAAQADQYGGKIIGIEPGSGIMQETADAISTYQLPMQLVEGSTAAMTAALKAATDRKEPIAVTLWRPSWMVMKYDMKFLEDPESIYPPAQSYYWVGTAGFSQENPRAREILASIYVPLDDITAINSAVNDGATMDQAIDAWLTDHADLISRWKNMKD